MGVMISALVPTSERPDQTVLGHCQHQWSRVQSPLPQVTGIMNQSQCLETRAQHDRKRISVVLETFEDPNLMHCS